MKINTFFLSIFSFALFATAADAQFDMPKYADVSALKGRQLIVVVSQLDNGLMDKITKTGSEGLLAEYKAYITNYNSNMKAAATKLWNFTGKDIVFKSAEEVSELAKDKSQRDKYVVMYCHNLVNKHDFGLRIDDNKKDPHITGSVTYFSMAYPGESPFYEILLSLVMPSTREIVYCVATSNYNFNYVYNQKSNCDMKLMIEGNSRMLYGKTLLILKEELNKDVANDISKYYPGVVRQVSYKELLSAVMTADANSAYVMTTQYNLNNGACTDWIVNCADGATLAHRKTHDYYLGYGKDFFLDMAPFYNSGKK